MQVRWVFYPIDTGTVNATAELSLTRNPELVGSIINHQHSSPPANASQASVDAFRLNQNSLTQLNNVFKNFNQQHVISPTFIWKDDSTVWVTRGYDLATFKTLALPLIQKGAMQ